MFYVTAKTLKQIQDNFDIFDDSYTEPFKSTEELLAFFATMDENVSFSSSLNQIYSFTLDFLNFTGEREI